jgi:hypothetical protein
LTVEVKRFYEKLLTKITTRLRLLDLKRQGKEQELNNELEQMQIAIDE